MISSLLHLVGLRPRVYYTLTNFRGGGQGPLGPPPPQYANGFRGFNPPPEIFRFFLKSEGKEIERKRKNRDVGGGGVGGYLLT